MSDRPRDPDPDDAPTRRSFFDRAADESGDDAAAWPQGSAGPAGGASSQAGSPVGGSSSAAGSPVGGSSSAVGSQAGGTSAGSSSGSPTPAAPGSGGQPGRGSGRRRRWLSFGPPRKGPLDQQQRRRRRWFVTLVSVGGAIIAIALCAGALSVISAIDGARDRAAEAREARALRDRSCLELERRLNKLIPPGATAGPGGRAAAIRNENAAVRIYVQELTEQDEQDGWRQLLDARTVYADALDRQSKSSTPAFYVAPRADDGEAVTTQLEDDSPAACDGAIRRLAAPDL